MRAEQVRGGADVVAAHEDAHEPAVEKSASGFDKLARLYRWMEYLSFGPLLWWTRTTWLSDLLDTRTALVLGDGDGRFIAELLRRNPRVHVTAIDASPAMLEATRRRAAASGCGGRLRALCTDARTWSYAEPVDLVCTHFFLDCLTEVETRDLVSRCAACLRPGGRWVVSEFAVPRGPAHVPAAILVRALYAAFRLLTGLRVRVIPDYAAALQVAGLQRVALRTRLCGLLRAEVWARPLQSASIEA